MTLKACGVSQTLLELDPADARVAMSNAEAEARSGGP